MKKLKSTKEKATPLQESLDRFGKRLSVGILVICAGLFAVSVLVRGENVMDAFLFSVALAVAAVALGVLAAMFLLMLWNTGLVFAGVRDLQEVVTILWTFQVPWHWAYHRPLISDGVAQFAFGFYSVMLTSTILGLVTMVLFKPRSWCVYCPMGTMTTLICKVKAKECV